MLRVFLQHRGIKSCFIGQSLWFGKFPPRPPVQPQTPQLRNFSRTLCDRSFLVSAKNHARSNFKICALQFGRGSQFSSLPSDKELNKSQALERNVDDLGQSQPAEEEHNLEKESEQSGENISEEKPLNVDEELLRYDYEEFELGYEKVEEVKEKKPKKSIPFELKRGKSGVFELEEICALLKNDNARDMCVIRVPPEFKYVDFLVFATGRSTRHIRAMAEYIQWIYKQKRSRKDPESVKIEGELTKDWFAIDLGNIALHLMLKETRKTYDLEQLWSVGAEFDEHLQCQVLSHIAGASSLEAFSFEAELEKFRQLREEESKSTTQQTGSD